MKVQSAAPFDSWMHMAAAAYGVNEPYLSYLDHADRTLWFFTALPNPLTNEEKDLIRNIKSLADRFSFGDVEYV